ncbi:hypothetical protein [Streptomyces sp. CBMA152]|uniref:hypothetical protein n=1 Tax=Streptomyces sp. CBMA152 TaxID=1896312 RepID=UPI0016611F5F|nr:hypothetical protein [Streptomyces sp. CBMA152]MBD0743066.1 hypothetical protein [Streptomyces sp. CBMA152]
MAENKDQGAEEAPKALLVERTDFESKSHEEMWAMVQGMKGESADGLAKKLTKASTAITKIGDDLKLHMSRVVWQGEGAKAFTDWGHDAAMATLELGKYSQDASSWLASVSHAITQAKSAVPAYDPALKQQATDAHSEYIAAHHDPDAIQEARDASTKLTGLNQKMEGQRQEAVRELKRLSDVYVQSGQQVAALRPPVFPPPPAAFVPPAQRIDGSQYVGGGSTSSASGRRTSTAQTGSHLSTPSATTSSTSARPHAVAPAAVTTPTHVPDRPVGTNIDGIGTLPPPTHVAPTGPVTTPTPSPVGRPDVGPMPPIGIPPTFTGGGKNGLPEPGVLGGRQTTGGLRGPSLPGRSTVGGLPPSAPPRQTGIVGGRPVPPSEGKPTSGIPRSTVIGEEGRQGPQGSTQGRPPMAHGPGGHMGGGGGSRGGFSGGRRLAGEPGGIVGGRPTEPGVRSGRPFTEGGSGLVRNGAAEGNPQAGRSGGRGMIPPGMHGPAGRRDERGGERPDYLTEDEETWQQSDRRIVPPVID